MKNSSCIISAYNIVANGEGTALLPEDVSANLATEGVLTWVHLDTLHPECERWLEKEVRDIDDLIINALLAEETSPRLVEFDSGVLLILRGVNLSENAEPEDMISVRLWVDSYRIISLQRRDLKATKDICQRLEAGRGPNSSGDFVAQLAECLLQNMEPFFVELDVRLDDIEEKILDKPEVTERQRIIAIRKQAIIIRRYIAPQREAVARLVNLERPWLTMKNKRRLQESTDHIVRYIEDLDEIRDRAQVVKDELVNALSDRMNRNLYMLSIISAIFLPLGFLTGLLGINVGGIPGSEDGSAFYLFCGMLAVLIFIQVLILKKFKWF
jgi:zinc transporter